MTHFNRMKRRTLPLLICCAALSTALGQTPAGQSVVEDDRTLTFDCRGGYVRVDGDDNTLTLTGRCTTLTVNGDGNKIRAATVGSIVLNGNDNTVRWAKALKGARPTVNNPGSGNSIVHR